MCRVLGVSRPAYHQWLKRPPSQRARDDVALREKIHQLHTQHHQRIGAVKTWHLLTRAGVAAGKHRVARVRRQEGLEAARKQRFRVMHRHQQTEPPAADLVKRRFEPSSPNKVWVSDITSIRTVEGWVHLAIVLDLYARVLVGWALAANQTVELPIAAMRMALARRRPLPGCIAHSDQGSVYGATSYRDVLSEAGMRPSMSRRGNCHDNAVAESFFSNLKNELSHGRRFETRKEAMHALADYIELYYNRRRLHQSLGYRTPAEAEVQFVAPH